MMTLVFIYHFNNTSSRYFDTTHLQESSISKSSLCLQFYPTTLLPHATYLPSCRVSNVSVWVVFVVTYCFKCLMKLHLESEVGASIRKHVTYSSSVVHLHKSHLVFLPICSYEVFWPQGTFSFLLSFFFTY